MKEVILMARHDSFKHKSCVVTVYPQAVTLKSQQHHSLLTGLAATSLNMIFAECIRQRI